MGEMKEARFYENIGDNTVRCHLCAHLCKIVDGRRGICGVRENRGGRLFTHVYGRVISRNIDPIEKKPLFHFYPGTRSYSIATVGCNFRCLHCQNYEISQMPKERGLILGEDVNPEEIVRDALNHKSSSISYTYTEPTIFMEYAYDISKLAVASGLKNVFVTNGYMTKEALLEINPFLHAANVDIKSFREDFYKRVCGAKLSPVLDSITLMKEIGIWVEATTLIIPTQNDSEEELRDIARWIYKTSPSIPWHISAFYPAYKMTNLPRTPVSVVERAREIGLEEGLRYVYTGNIPGDPGESTYCYKCGNMLIERYGFYIRENRIKDSTCPYCNVEIDGVGL